MGTGHVAVSGSVGNGSLQGLMWLNSVIQSLQEENIEAQKYE